MVICDKLLRARTYVRAATGNNNDAVERKEKVVIDDGVGIFQKSRGSTSISVSVGIICVGVKRCVGAHRSV